MLDNVDLPLFIHTVLHSLLPWQMLIANEQIQVLRVVGQGESTVSNEANKNSDSIFVFTQESLVLCTRPYSEGQVELLNWLQLRL